MGQLNLLGVVLATAAFWLVGALWYGVVFGKVWQREDWDYRTTRRAAGSRW